MQSQEKKSVAFLYVNDKHTKKEIRDISPFITSSKYKISWNKSNHRSKRLYDENIQTLKKEL